MVAVKNLKSNALISVYDKSSLKQLCSALTKFKIGIISTGETAKKLNLWVLRMGAKMYPINWV